MELDTVFTRSQFPQLSDNSDFVFCANAGGSHVARQVGEIFDRYNHHLRVQPYSGYSPSIEAGQAMDRALDGWSEALDVSRDELTIGPSTSMNTYVLAQAIGPDLHPGDQIIITNQDHESNRGVWLRMARQRGVEVRQWKVEPDSGLLDPEALKLLLTDRTRWVFVTHCSNLVGTVNPVEEYAEMIRACSPARVFVDGVSYAPHHVVAPKDLNVDGYAFSLYKVFGPHQGILYLDRRIADTLDPQCHDFNREFADKWFNAAGPLHAEVAACAGVLDYFDDLHRHHFGESGRNLREKIDALHSLTRPHEDALTSSLLECLAGIPEVRILGKPDTRGGDRVSTIAFRHIHRRSADICSALQNRGIGCEHGNFYAYRLVQDLDVDPEDGFVRISLVHYTSVEETGRIIGAIGEVLD